MSEIGLRVSDYRHVQMYDEYVDDVDPGTEEAAWLQGYIVRMIIKAIAR